VNTGSHDDSMAAKAISSVTKLANRFDRASLCPTCREAAP
jgi:hypothetical protein